MAIFLLLLLHHHHRRHRHHHVIVSLTIHPSIFKFFPSTSAFLVSFLGSCTCCSLGLGCPCSPVSSWFKCFPYLHGLNILPYPHGLHATTLHPYSLNASCHILMVQIFPPPPTISSYLLPHLLRIYSSVPFSVAPSLISQ